MRTALALAALFAALFATADANARNQVWNQATWVQNIGGGSDTITYPANSSILGFMNGTSAACSIAVVGQDMGAGTANAVTITQVQSGQLIPMSVTRVMATNTTCSAIFLFGTTGQ